MRLTIPLTGTAIKAKDGVGAVDGSYFGGAVNNPIRPAVNIGDMAWRAISFDLDAGTMEIECEPPPKRDLVKLKGKPARYEWELSEKETKDIQDGKVIPEIIAESESQYKVRADKIVADAQVLLSRPLDEIYEMAGKPKLKVISEPEA